MKKFKIGILLSLAIIMFISIFTLNIDIKSVQADYSNYNQELINSVNIDEDILSEAKSKTETTKIYNLVVFFRFNDQNEFLDDTYSVDGKDYTYLEILDASYNTSKYSLRNYYLTVSNNKLDITTIYLFAGASSASSLLIDESQKYFLAHQDKYDANSYEKLHGYSNTVGYKNNSEMQVRAGQLSLKWQDVMQKTFDNDAILPKNAKMTETYQYSVLDHDNKGDIDSLTLQYYPQLEKKVMGMEWGAPLWSYKSSLYNGPKKTLSSKTLQVDTFNQTYMNYYTLLCDKSSTSPVVIVNISTCIHEMGHVLGLLDLYSYEDQHGTTYKDLPVGYWSVMAFNSSLTGQFSTSYERELLNWLDDTNILQISREGSYTLDVVRGGGNDGIVAYKIPIDNGNKYLYLEYRNNASEAINIFDTRLKSLYIVSEGYSTGTTYYSGVTNSGLLVYVVDTSKSVATNNITKYSKPSVVSPNTVSWGLEVLSTYPYANDPYKDNATLKLNDSLGNVDKSSLDNAIYYYAYDKSGKKNTGLRVTVTELSDYTLTFSIEGGDLLPPEITKEDIGNDTLYNKLLEIAGTEALYPNSFANVAYMDLSECQIQSLSFLDLFDISNLQCINLYGNKISFSGDYGRYNKDKLTSLATSVKIIMANNQVDLDSLYSSNFPLLDNSNILWGIQGITNTIAFNENIELKYHINFNFATGTTVKVIKTDTTGESTSNLTGSGTLSFAPGAEYNIVYAFYFEELKLCEKSVIFDLVSLDSKYSTSGNCYSVYNNRLNEIDFWDLINVYPRIDGLSANSLEFTDDELSGNIPKTLQLKYSDQIIAELDVYFNVLSPTLISISDLDTTLYSILQTKYGLAGEIYNSDLISHSIIELSGYGLESIKGLEKFVFKNDAIINLSNNKLDNAEEIKNLCSNNTTLNSIVLINNSFASGNINEMRNKAGTIYLIFAMQNVQNMIISGTDNNIYEFEKYGDFGSLFSQEIKCDSSEIFCHSLSSKYKIEGKGKVDFIFKNDKIGKIIVSVTLAKVVLKEKYSNIELNYGEQFSCDYSWFDSSIANVQNYLTVNTDQVNFNFLGSYNIIYTFSNAYSITQQLTIVDKVAPIITLNGNSTVYIDLYNYNSFSDAGANAIDNYDGNIDVYVDMSELTESVGAYTITYTATDSSGNTDTKVRTVVVGTVLLERTNAVANVMSYAKIPVVFAQFKQSEFDVEIKLNGQSIQYNFANGYRLENIGENQFDISLTYQNDENIKYDLVYKVNVIDTEAPQITLVGESSLCLYESEKYVEKGIIYTDNSVDGVYNLTETTNKLICLVYYYDENDNQIQNLQNAKVGEYLVVYKVIDNFGEGLSSVKTRAVTIVFTQVKTLSIDVNNTLPRYESGFDINIEVALTSDEGGIDSIPNVSWYINGECVQTGNTNILNYKFTKSGQYTIYAVVDNYDKTGNASNKIYSNSFVVEVYSTNILTTPILYIVLIIVAIVIVGFIIFFVRKHKNKYFY